VLAANARVLLSTGLSIAASRGGVEEDLVRACRTPVCLSKKLLGEPFQKPSLFEATRTS
jgi:hypothetical protein